MNTENFTSFASPAKLNLFLHIVGRRADGYHELETLFQFLDHGDTIDINVTQSPTIDLLTPITGVDNEDNLIVKAAKLLQQHTGCHLGAQIKVTKILPMGGGLGGGSSNAATILLALNRIWKTNISTQALATLGLSLGADVPIFIHGFSAFAQGIGENLTAKHPEEKWYLVSKPNCSISTVDVFTAADLPRNSKKFTAEEIKSGFNIEQCHNDCQTMVIKHYPEVANLLAWLLEYAPSRMTGTGACIFSNFTSESEALIVQAQLPKGIESFVAKGINNSPLLAQISAISND